MKRLSKVFNEIYYTFKNINYLRSFKQRRNSFIASGLSYYLIRQGLLIHRTYKLGTVVNHISFWTLIVRSILYFIIIMGRSATEWILKKTHPHVGIIHNKQYTNIVHESALLNSTYWTTQARHGKTTVVETVSYRHMDDRCRTQESWDCQGLYRTLSLKRAASAHTMAANNI